MQAAITAATATYPGVDPQLLAAIYVAEGGSKAIDTRVPFRDWRGHCSSELVDEAVRAHDPSIRVGVDADFSCRLGPDPAT